MSSAAEAETCGTFNKRKTSIYTLTELITLDHKQPATPLKTDNSTTEGFLNSVMKPKHSKTWNMKWHCLIDKEVLDQLRVYLDIYMRNEADYFTKHDPPIHHS